MLGAIIGDADTQACIAGAIAEAFYKDIPEEIKLGVIGLLQKEFVDLLEEFGSYISSSTTPHNMLLCKVC